MAEQKINLRKVRDFGENINDAFVLIKKNSSTYLKSFFAICGIFMLAQAISGGYFQTRSLGLFQRILSRSGSMDFRYFWNLLGPAYLVIVLLSVLTIVSMQVALTAYLKLYNGQEGKPAIADVWNEFRRYYLIVLGYHLLLYLILFAAACVLVIPVAMISIFLAPLMVIILLAGIVYIYTNLMPFTLVIMIEDKGFPEAIRRCFYIVKDHFWMSFAIYLVAYLIYSLGSLFIGAAAGIIGLIVSLLTVAKMTSVIGILTSFLSIFSLSFYVIYFTCVALNYFSLVERKDGTGLLGRIDNIGNPAGYGNAEEQY